MRWILILVAAIVAVPIALKVAGVLGQVLAHPLTWFLSTLLSGFLLYIRVSNLTEAEKIRREVRREERKEEEKVEEGKREEAEEVSTSPPPDAVEEIVSRAKRVVVPKGAVLQKHRKVLRPLIQELPEEEFLRRIEILRRRILGQDQAIEKVIKGLKALYYGTRLRKEKPLVFLFLGEPGTGKTETAKQVAELFFGGRLLFLPMNQYSDEHTSWSLFGSPKGFAGSDKGGDLTQGVKVQLQGSGVILLDEIEKASKKLWQHFFQGFDEGRIKDISFDEWVDVSKCVFIMTSNLASDRAEWMKSKSDSELRDFIASQLPSEVGGAFASRIDYIAVYGKLPKEAVREIVKRKLRKALENAQIVVENEEVLVEEITEIAQERSVREIDVIIEETLLDLMEGS